MFPAACIHSPISCSPKASVFLPSDRWSYCKYLHMVPKINNFVNNFRFIKKDLQILTSG